MGSEPEQWAKDWLAEQRRQGKTGLTVERRGGIHIVRWATTWWDSVNKKRHKESLYCGVLSEDGTIVEKRIDHERRTRPESPSGHRPGIQTRPQDGTG